MQLAGYEKAIKQHGTAKAAAAALDMNYHTFRSRMSRLKNEKIPTKSKTRGARTGHIPKKTYDFRRFLDVRMDQYDRQLAHETAWDWAEVFIPDSKPVGLMVFGDPHLDNPGTHIEEFVDHLYLAKDTPGVYAVNLGDVTDNWTGKLMAKYQDHVVSRGDAMEATRHIMNDFGVHWLLWLIGNHDVWESGQHILEGLNSKNTLMRYWDAKVNFNFPGEQVIKVHAAHSFKGTSMYSPTYGAAKHATLAQDADLWICGHFHESGIQVFEARHSNKIFTLGQASGYKKIDNYARAGGFGSCRSGSSIFFILDPSAEQPEDRVLPFLNPRTGVKFLKTMRRQR